MNEKIIKNLKVDCDVFYSHNKLHIGHNQITHDKNTKRNSVRHLQVIPKNGTLLKKKGYRLS